MKKTYIKIFFLSLLTGFFISCAKMHFSNNQPTSETQKYSYFMCYLQGKMSKESVENWFFAKSSEFHAKVVQSQFELKGRALTQQEIDRALALEYDLNMAIHKFNDSNYFWRGYEFSKTLLGKSFGSADNETPQESVSRIRNEGLSPSQMADSALGTMNSVFRYGFILERVNFLKYAKVSAAQKPLYE